MKLHAVTVKQYKEKYIWDIFNSENQGQVQRYLVIVPTHLSNERLNNMTLLIILRGRIVLEIWET